MTTFLRAHSWLNWVDEDDDEDEVGLKKSQKTLDTSKRLHRPKCQLLQTSSQLGQIQQGKTFNNQFFIYGSECEKNIYLAIWCVCVCGGGGLQ